MMLSLKKKTGPSAFPTENVSKVSEEGKGVGTLFGEKKVFQIGLTVPKEKREGEEDGSCRSIPAGRRIPPGRGGTIELVLQT